MSNDDDSYEVLFSSADYIHLQQQCQQLEKVKVELEEKNKAQLSDNRALSTKVFDLRELVDSLNQKQKTLSEQNLEVKIELLKTQQQLKIITYKLQEVQKSQQATSQKLQQSEEKILQLTSYQKLKQQNFRQLQVSHEQKLQTAAKRQKEMIQSHEKQKNSVIERLILKIGDLEKIIEDKSRAIQEKNRQCQYLDQKEKILTNNLNLIQKEYDTMSALLQAQVKEKIQLNSTLKTKISQNQSRSNEYQSLINNKNKIIEDLQAMALDLKSQTCLLKDRITEIEQKLLRTQAQKENFIEILNEFKTKSSQKQMQLVEKYSQQAKIFEQKLVMHTSTIEKLRSELHEAQSKKKQSSQKMKNKLSQIEKQLQRQKKYQQDMQKQYDTIIFQMNSESTKQKKSKNEKDQLKQVKQLLKSYFSNMIVGLFDIGNLDQGEIRTILEQQRDIVKQFVVDAVQPFLENKGYKNG